MPPLVVRPASIQSSKLLSCGPEWAHCIALHPKRRSSGDSHKTILDPVATREHVTLEYLHNNGPLSFAIPNVHYHAEHNGRYYIILSRLAGQTLTTAWPNMDEAIEQHYVSRVASICKELATWQADCISGVDGQHLLCPLLTQIGWPKDFSSRNLLDNCKALGMDCSIFSLYHCDLGPGNILVAEETLQKVSPML